MKNFTMLFKTIFFLLLSASALAQVTGDFRSVASGNWSAASTWETYNGSTWGAASGAPTAANSAYLQIGFTVTVDQLSAVNDLHINTGAATLLALGDNVLEVNGKLRAYTGAAGTIPGTSTNNLPNSGFITSASGKLKIVGLTRNITNSGEWGNNPASGFTAEFALNADETGTIATGFKAGTIIIASATNIFNSGVRPDKGSAGTGDLLIKAGSTMRVGNSGIFQRVNTASATAHFNSLILEYGATLEIMNQAMVIGATTVDFDGTVNYSSTSNPQTLATIGGNTAATAPNQYSFLTLTATGKTIPDNQTITVDSVLSMRTISASAPSLVIGTGASLVYGPTATLQYRGIGSPPPSQVTGSTEWPDATSSASKPYRVEVFNQSDVTINANKTVSALKLSGNTDVSAKLILGNFSLLIDSITIANNSLRTKYVVTNGTGGLGITNVGSDPVIFPVGPSTTLYHPATVTNAGVVDAIGVSVSSVVPPCAATNSVNALWTMLEFVPGGSNVTLTLNFEGAATTGTFEPATAQIVQCSGVGVIRHDGVVNNNEATGSGFTSFTQFGVTSNATVLPVKLSDFRAVKNADKTLLSWVSLTENNLEGFEVQRSANGRNFTSIGFLKANGAGKYEFADAAPSNGSNYYRLKMVDNNGSFEYSVVRLVHFGNGKGIKVFPTLVTSRINVVMENNEKTAYFISNTMGQVIQSGYITETTILDASRLKAGMYTLRVGSSSFKFVKE